MSSVVVVFEPPSRLRVAVSNLCVARPSKCAPLSPQTQPQPLKNTHNKGGLEVVGGASIGHTDPFAVATALDAQLDLLTKV